MQNELHIFKVYFGLPKIENKNNSDSILLGNFNASSPCNINLVCPQGNAWQTERKAVCLIQREDGAHASGALINNTCNLLIPYLLTAWHVTDGSNPNNWTFLFNWWSSSCTSNTNTAQSILFNGATLRATYEPTDFSLLELNQVPSTNLSLSFLGWDRGNAIPTSTTGIHHPMGDQMKISFDIDPATIGNVRNNVNTAWRVLWKLGTTEHGSSGSPLFNQNHLVVGQLFSGSQPVGPPCNQQTGGNNYGRFDLSWTGGGTNSTRLSNWLDPSSSGAIATNTTNISALISNNFAIDGPTSFCNSGIYSIPNSPVGSTVTWSANPSYGVVSLTPNGAQVTVNKNNAGLFDLIATVTYCGTNTTVTKNNITAGVPLYGNVYAAEGQNLELKSWAEGYNLIWENSWVYWGLTGTVASQYSLVGGNTTTSWTSTDYFPNVTFYMDPSNYLTFEVATSNGTCQETLHYTFVAIQNPNSYGYYSLAPNPVSSDLTIYVDEEKLKNQKIEKSPDQVIQQVIVLDKFGKVMMQQSYAPNSQKVTLNVSRLPVDMYVVRVYNGKQWIPIKFFKK